MIEIVDDPKLLQFLKNAFRLLEKAEDGDSQTFGPFRVRDRKFSVRHEAGAWELLERIDVSYRNFIAKRDKIVELAEQNRDMPRDKFIELLIQACIATDVVSRRAILDIVDQAANLRSHLESIETGRDLETIAMEFDDEFIKGVLNRRRGRDPRRHLWWVDKQGVYYLADDRSVSERLVRCASPATFPVEPGKSDKVRTSTT